MLSAGFFGVGAAMMVAIPTIPVRLVGLAPESPTLIGAMNHESLIVANVLGQRRDYRGGLWPVSPL